MRAGKYLVAVLVLALALIPSVALAEDYGPGESATLYTEVLDSAGDPVNDATVTIDIYDSDGDLIVDGESMVHVAGSDGIYEYDLTMPTTEGVYIATSTATDYGQDSTTIHIIGSTFSEAVLGGENMIYLILAIALTIAAFALEKWRMILGFASAGGWLLLGVYNYTQSTQTWDTQYAVFFFAMFMTVGMALVAVAFRDKGKEEWREETDEYGLGGPVMVQYRKGSRTGKTRELTELESQARAYRIAQAKAEKKAARHKI